MADRGFDYDLSSNLLTAALVEDQKRVQSAIDGIESGNLAPTLAEEVADPEADTAELECTSEAEERLPNPNGTVLTILGEFNEDVSNRAASDPRVVEAVRRRDECVAATGYEVEPGINALSAVVADADAIVHEHVAGSLSSQSALDLLFRLLPIETALSQCEAAYSEIAAVVSAEAWDEVIEANPGLIEEVRQATAEQVAIFNDYL